MTRLPDRAGLQRSAKPPAPLDNAPRPRTPLAPPAAAPAEDETPNEALRVACDALWAWMEEFNGVTRTIFRKRPEVLRDLHL